MAKITVIAYKSEDARKDGTKEYVEVGAAHNADELNKLISRQLHNNSEYHFISYIYRKKHIDHVEALRKLGQHIESEDFDDDDIGPIGL